VLGLLAEKRRALITRAVTRGLDPRAPLRDSGIPWLGEIPAHWELKRLKHVGRSIIGLTFDPADTVTDGSGVLVLRASNVRDQQIVLEDNLFVSMDIPEQLRTRVGDILICSWSGSRTLIGKNALIDESSSGLTFGAFMTVFRSPHNEYLFYVFNSPLFDYQAGAFSTSTINQLTVETLNGMEVPLPPASEQKAIVANLRQDTARLDRLVEANERTIALLKERRAALIAAAVTGQIDVESAA
jgi:type I restriction enzyme S subunit